ncbi:hypothetical protein [Halomonas sp. C05BenzN]|uniref:hypothetical protein n=1 Tax=Halomonas sp. C05BenzN TaxID=3411041 RepID=UPI003B9231D8
MPGISEVMMADGMHIQADWCLPAAAAGTEAGKAEWSLSINGQLATELEDLGTGVVRERVVAPLELLGEWLAHNWWRLRWEPEQQRPDHDWRMSHCLPAIGGGVAWPNLMFSSDGDFILCRCEPTAKLKGGGMPVRYLSRFEESITADAFERGVDGFMSRLGERLDISRYRQDLIDLWNAVLEERRNPDAAIWRKLEALLGFDVDEGPEGLLSQLTQRFDTLGREAVSEVAAEGRHDSLQVLARLELTAARAPVGAAPPEEQALRSAIQRIPHNQPTWRRAAEAARMARRQWNLGDGPLLDAQLLDLLELPKEVLSESSGAPHGLPVAMRTERGLRIALERKRLTGKRFALARILADELLAPPDDRLLPVTDSKTVRQRFQRAFAQEFLCPFSSLEEELSNQPVNEEFIEDTAERYGVSFQTVSYLLQNHGVWDAA